MKVVKHIKGDTGWIFGVAKDQMGAYRFLERWDESSHDDLEWRWVHLDSRDPDSRGWLRKKAGRWMTDRLLEEGSELQPRVVYNESYGALLVTLQMSMGALAPAPIAPSTSSLRMWISERSKIAVSTTDNTSLLEILDFENTLNTTKPRDLGEVVALLAGSITEANISTCRGLEDKLYNVKGELQKKSLSAGAGAPVPWRNLTDLRSDAVPLIYETILQRRHATPQRDAIGELVSVASSPTQTFFSEKSQYALTELAVKQDALVKRLDALCSTSEVLSSQIMDHVTWHGALSSQRLAYLGTFLGILGSASVTMDIWNAIMNS